jgi:hypothetical protein
MTEREILNTRFIVIPEDNGTWFAQGLDVDYFASGEFPEEAVEAFQDGLKTMIKLHKEKFGNLDKIHAPFIDVLKAQGII